MAVQLSTKGTPTAVIAMINALQPSNHPGQDVQLARVQAAAIAEVQAFPAATNVIFDLQCHRDNLTSKVTILVEPVRLPNGLISL